MDAQPFRLGCRPALDGVRGLAIALVLCLHLWFLLPGDPLMGGYEGVTMFFVLSGFLIVTVVGGAWHPDRISVGGFGRRRALRLLPALYLMLIAAHDASRMISAVASAFWIRAELSARSPATSTTGT
jgi:peptidoglycan/LPS O-acetylase OafA/YrhL